MEENFKNSQKDTLSRFCQRIHEFLTAYGAKGDINIRDAGTFLCPCKSSPLQILREGRKSTPNEQKGTRRRRPIKNDITARDTCLPGCETQSYPSLLPAFFRSRAGYPEMKICFGVFFSGYVIYSRATLSAVVPIL